MKVLRIFLLCCFFGVSVLYAEVSLCHGVKKISIAACGNETIEKILKKNEKCEIASRLVKFATWLDSIGKPCSFIEPEVRKRYVTLSDTVRYEIDYTDALFIGDSTASVKIMMYASMSCPLCKRLFKDAADSLIKRNKDVALYVKPFASSEPNQALVAIRKWNKHRELLYALAPVKEMVTMQIVFHITDSMNVPHDELNKIISSGEFRAYTDSSRAEGMRNGVDVTPTFFINGKRYHGYKDIRWVLDAADYELWKIGAGKQGKK